MQAVCCDHTVSVDGKAAGDVQVEIRGRGLDITVMPSWPTCQLYHVTVGEISHLDSRMCYKRKLDARKGEIVAL